jgi:hypothetical protein
MMVMVMLMMMMMMRMMVMVMMMMMTIVNVEQRPGWTGHVRYMVKVIKGLMMIVIMMFMGC